METIVDKGRTLCVIVPAAPAPVSTAFYTSAESALQVGKIVHLAGGEVRRHSHRRMERTVECVAEVLFVQTGRAVLDIYADDRTLLCSREVVSGDTIILTGGGHGIRLLEDTVLLEVKHGPYLGAEEKEFF